MHRIDVWRMIRRRAADASLHAKIGCHTFRATGITAYLEAGGTLENAQAMAVHESPRTTKLYDRTGDEITLDEVERITMTLHPRPPDLCFVGDDIYSLYGEDLICKRTIPCSPQPRPRF